MNISIKLKIVKSHKNQNGFHFYLYRSAKYKKNTDRFAASDLQHVDMGIAMCHFELTAKDLGLKGQWQQSMPPIELPDDHWEYIVSWKI
jgi:hypothetical protein